MALLEGPSVYVHLDPRREGVMVPKWLSNQPQLVLQIGMTLAIPIPDLEIDDDGIACTLSFNQRPHGCYMPWSAIFAMVDEDGRGMIWPDDVPGELAAQARRAAMKVASKKGPRKDDKAPGQAARAEPRLAIVEGGEAGPDEPEESTAGDDEPPAPAVSGAGRYDDGESAASDGNAAVADTPGRHVGVDDDDDPDGGGKKKKLPPYLRGVK